MDERRQFVARQAGSVRQHPDRVGRHSGASPPSSHGASADTGGIRQHRVVVELPQRGGRANVSLEVTASVLRCRLDGRWHFLILGLSVLRARTGLCILHRPSLVSMG